ncbi:MAG TPA: fatty acid desaturase, partial [Anaerolineae bacterium]|nr:fatty acid desaturase [Anaerolineae bacterium]
MTTLSTERAAPAQADWRKAVAQFQHPDVRRSVWQLIDSIVPYVALWVLMYFSLSISYWLTLALSVLAAGFLVRVFIIFHDAGHGSFFRLARANDIVGIITGIITFTPYYAWRHSHAIHHATSGDLDRRGVGDVWTMTVDEYLNAPWSTRIAYRVFRFPPIMFTLGPLFMFLVIHRLTVGVTGQRERHSVWWTNLALLLIVIVAALTIGLRDYVLVQLPIIFFGGAAGVWMFYVQHQFEGMVWEHHEQWDFVMAALQGSSFYKLPRILQWFTGNIGFHHIHHLSPRIPNYNLEPCHNSSPLFQSVPPITLRSSLVSLKFRLWDERS